MNIFKETPKTKKGKIILISSISVSALLVGGCAGYLLGHFLKTPNQDFSGIDSNSLYDSDNANLVERFDESLKNNEDIQSTYRLDQIANYAIEKFRASTHSVAYGYGKGNAAVNLDILNCVIRDEDKYMEESISKSVAGSILDIVVAQRDYQSGPSDDDSVLSYLGKIPSKIEEPDWSNPTTKDYTVSSYRSTFGKNVDYPVVYLLSSKTVLTDKNNTVGTADNPNSYITETESGYKLYMNLDPIKSVVNYYKRMINLSGSNVNSFFYVHLTFNLDKNYQLISSFSEEKYSASMSNIPSTVVGTMETYFFKDTTSYSIPDISTNIAYPNKGELN